MKRNRRGDARCFSQDIMRGEWQAGRQAGMIDKRVDVAGGLTCPGQAAQFDGYRVKEGTRSSTETSGTSIFDPVLSELMCRWFCPLGGTILDPFAGGSVRGIVASKLGYRYVGVELRAEQLVANTEQADRICVDGDARPLWIEGDSLELGDLVGGATFDFVFSCPPYYDLEVYSDDPRDLSTMSWDQFSRAYSQIIKASVDLLLDNRFACFVVGDVRGKDGFYRGLPELTSEAFRAAGARKYNDAVLVTAAGSLPIRARGQFEASRKLGKTHQNVMVFCKGDPRVAAKSVVSSRKAGRT